MWYELAGLGDRSVFARFRIGERIQAAAWTVEHSLRVELVEIHARDPDFLKVTWAEHARAFEQSEDSFSFGACHGVVRKCRGMFVSPDESLLFAARKATRIRAPSPAARAFLRVRQTRLFVVGLATDFCIAYSALDARRLGFEATVIEAGRRGIDVEGSFAAAWKQLAAAGVIRA